jgi:hypothetical protein
MFRNKNLHNQRILKLHDWDYLVDCAPIFAPKYKTTKVINNNPALLIKSSGRLVTKPPKIEEAKEINIIETIYRFCL